MIEELGSKGKVVVEGRSMGSRVASMIADDLTMQERCRTALSRISLSDAQSVALIC